MKSTIITRTNPPRRTCSNCYRPRNILDKDDRVTVEREVFSRLCVDYKGGLCLVCGYNKCTRVLCFHHLEPNDKLFQVSIGWKKGWKATYTEMDKCVLLCSNCHGETHVGLISKEKLIELENNRMALTINSGMI